MRHPSVLLLALAAFAPGVLAAVDGGEPTRKRGTIYKDEVDGLIAVLRDTARASKASAAAAGVLGDTTGSTAKILTAMAHCHRRYHTSDGPVVRPSLDYLLQQRRADGSFGDAATTAWVLDALTCMDGDGFREEVAVARRWLEQKGGSTDPFAAEVAAVLAEVRADRFPQHLAGEAAQRSRAWFSAPSTLDRAAAADDLVRLVACQVANKKLDRDAQGQDAVAWTDVQQKAFDYVFAQQENGVFSVKMPVDGPDGKSVMRSFPDPALTGFGLFALQTKPKARRSEAEQKVIDQGCRWLLEGQNEDGTFGDRVPNYTTCVVVGALKRWGDDAAAGALQKAQRAILGFQNLEATGYQRSDRDYGSIGYGNSQRGDLSNLHFSLEALRSTGLPADHEAFQKALVFLQRTQNLKSVNDFAEKVPDPDREGVILDATSGDDGGAAYYPGNSAAGYIVQPDGKVVPRSYGSMTYALLKSYTLSGLPKDDPRVAAAVRWIQDNWTLAVNPGADPELGEKTKYQGLFYYYMVLAQALATTGIDSFETTGEDGKKVKVDWRQELRDKLKSLQSADGSWVNGKNGRWMESLPLLCTCYAMTALDLCQ